jgi:phosphatidylglycerophosphate synthase
MGNSKNRRPLKIRGSSIFQNLAGFLSKKDITPNQISIISVLFAFLAALCLLSIPKSQGYLNWLLPLLAAFFIQMRLICNLLDGMVAIEGGKTTASGELFNDIPDRIADPLILIATGYAISFFEYSYMIGWCAGLMSVMTAYIRVLSVSIGAPANFSGPMAKQHRVAIMTVACILTSLEGLVWQQGYILVATLLIIIIGSIITSYRRTVFTYNYLENKKNV